MDKYSKIFCYISTCQTLVNKCFEYLLLLGGQEGEEGAWCYLEPECGAASWPSRGDCGGTKQSPIDLVTRGRRYQRPAQPLAFTGYDKVGAGTLAQHRNHLMLGCIQPAGQQWAHPGECSDWITLRIRGTKPWTKRASPYLLNSLS